MVKLSDLAELLSQKHQIEKDKIDKFLIEFVNVIHEGLSADNSVKIKGLGTFKIVNVKDRESVSVNTGERVIIYGHDKLSFTPDSIMKDVVNRPFSQFDSVEVNEGVEFDDDQQVSTVVDTSQLEDGVNDASANENLKENEAIEAAIANVDDSIPQATDSKLSVDNIEEDVENKPEAYLTEVSDNDNAEQTATKLAGLSDQEPVAEDNEVRDESKTVDTNDRQQATYEEVSKPSSMFQTLLYSCFALLIGFGLGFFVAKSIYNNKTNVLFVEQEQAEVNEDTLSENKAKTDVTSKKASDSQTVKTAKSNSVNNNIAEANEANVDYDKLQKEYEAKYSEVRYGAYRIVGVESTVTAKRGQTLQSISKSHLGPGMQCYVVAINDGIREVKEGQKVKIPKLKTKVTFRK